MTTVTQTIPTDETTPDPADQVIDLDGLTDDQLDGNARPGTVADDFRDVDPRDLPPIVADLVKAAGAQIARCAPHRLSVGIEAVLWEGPYGDHRPTMLIRDDVSDAAAVQYIHMALTKWLYLKPGDIPRTAKGDLFIPLGISTTDPGYDPDGAIGALRDLLDEHGAEVVELDGMPPEFLGYRLVLDGELLLYMPAGQDPGQRERIARRLLARPRSDA